MDAEDYYNRGVLKASINDDAGAMADFSKAIEIDPTYAGKEIVKDLYHKINEQQDWVFQESKKIFNNENAIIASEIEDKFKTVVNDFGCIHYTEKRFIEFILPQDIGKFEWCNYFVIPVDHEDRLILSKTYYQDSTSFFKSYSDILKPLNQYKATEYHDNLGTYEQLKQFAENYTQGATAIILRVLQNPLNPSPNNLINNADQIEDLGYLVLCYYVNFE